MSEPIEFRVLLALRAVDELCAGDLAAVLSVDDARISYALRMLRTAGLVRSRREGRAVYYRLAEGFPHPLLDQCENSRWSLVSHDAEKSR